LSQYTHVTDRRTDTETDSILIASLYRVCITCSAVKTSIDLGPTCFLHVTLHLMTVLCVAAEHGIGLLIKKKIHG